MPLEIAEPEKRTLPAVASPRPPITAARSATIRNCWSHSHAQLCGTTAPSAIGAADNADGTATEGVVRVTGDAGLSQILAGIEVALSVVLFTACSVYIRLRLRVLPPKPKKGAAA